jgi:protein-tyrosine phosphatase
VNLLFICSRNQWRSPTAENLYKNKAGISVRSAGTASSARKKVNAAMILWADLVLVMEKKHRSQLVEKFPDETAGKQIVVLHIPDEYRYMDPELVENIETAVAPYLHGIDQ